MSARMDDRNVVPADVRGMQRSTASSPASSPRPTRIVVLGGGFGGVAATRHLERLCGGRTDIDITLVSRDNFFVLTPLL
ncbi:MAG TPA: hypothetical protein VF041_07175, partial [Gemmatimonadaceae bacterium]